MAVNPTNTGSDATTDPIEAYITNRPGLKVSRVFSAPTVDTPEVVKVQHQPGSPVDSGIGTFGDTSTVANVTIVKRVSPLDGQGTVSYPITSYAETNQFLKPNIVRAPQAQVVGSNVKRSS